VDEYGFADELFNEQSGHKKHVGDKYALDFASIQHFPMERLQNFIRLSKFHHCILQSSSPPPRILRTVTTTATNPLPAASSQQVALNSHSLSRADVRELARLIGPEIISQLSPGIHATIADGFAAITPIQALTSTTATGSGSATATSPESQQLVDVNTISLGPARYSELRELLGINSTFKSKEQGAAVELSAHRKEDLLVILGTGGGKSLIFMAAAVNFDETKAGLVTVVIVPLVALLLDLQERLREKGIAVCNWSDLDAGSRSRYNFRTLLITVDGAATDTFLEYLHLLSNLRKLARIVLDEVHYVLMSEHYRPLFKFLPRMRQILVPVICLSATLPLVETSTLLRKLHMLPATKIIRASTVLPNMVYALFKLTPSRSEFIDRDGVQRDVKAYIQMSTQELKAKDRVLIFCLSREDTESLARLLGCSYYHSGLTNSVRAQTLKSWKQHTASSKILTTTSSLGAGMDYRHIPLVFHYGSARNMLDQAQEVGWAGRDGRVTNSVVFWDPKNPVMPLKPEQNSIGHKEQIQWLLSDQCRRIIPGQYLDG
jgi:superfamily II DNA helicase RecQ